MSSNANYNTTPNSGPVQRHVPIGTSNGMSNAMMYGGSSTMLAGGLFLGTGGQFESPRYGSVNALPGGGIGLAGVTGSGTGYGPGTNARQYQPASRPPRDNTPVGSSVLPSHQISSSTPGARGTPPVGNLPLPDGRQARPIIGYNGPRPENPPAALRFT